MRHTKYSRGLENLNDVLAVLSHLGLKAIARNAGWDIRDRKLSLLDQITLWVRAAWEGGDDSLAAMMMKRNARNPSEPPATEQALSYVDCHRPWVLFRDLFEELVRKADHRLRRFLGKFQIVALDGSMVKGLAPCLAGIFPLTSNEGRVLARLKIHMMLDLEIGPCGLKITDGNNCDGQHTDFIWKHVGCNSLLVFDLGYWNFGFLDEFARRGSHFVTRVFPNNNPIVVKMYRETAECRDYLAKLDRYDSHPMEYTVRVIEQKQPDGTWWRWCTNITDVDGFAAEEVVEVYRLRWQIEIFFRHLKRMLGLKRVHSTNVNAVMVELFAALIAFLLIHWLVRETAIRYPLPAHRQYSLSRTAALAGVLSHKLKLPLSRLPELTELVAEHCTTVVNQKRSKFLSATHAA